ncbi:hypothetical protein JXC34_06470 [Candidatus Woesearchaeota archaeon]|nr:hypothetical protein [Candidatus Woesearchaeota archaeon]
MDERELAYKAVDYLVATDTKNIFGEPDMCNVGPLSLFMFLYAVGKRVDFLNNKRGAFSYFEVISDGSSEELISPILLDGSADLELILGHRDSLFPYLSPVQLQDVYTYCGIEGLDNDSLKNANSDRIWELASYLADNTPNV